MLFPLDRHFGLYEDLGFCVSSPLKLRACVCVCECIRAFDIPRGILCVFMHILRVKGY